MRGAGAALRDGWLVMLGRWPLLVLAFGVLVVLVSCAGRGGVSISVSPGEVELAPGESVEFTAVVKGGAGTGVTWSTSGGELVPSGLTAVFTAPAEVGEYAVTARSTSDQGRWASARVTVVPLDDLPSVDSKGGIAEGVDGVSLIVPRGVVEEGEGLALTVDRVEAPDLVLPEDVQVLGSHYLFRVHRLSASGSSEVGGDEVATASPDGLLIALPVPEGADRERLALGVLVPGAYVMGGGSDEWVFVDGLFDEDRALFLVAVFRVPAQGLNIVLVADARAATSLNRAPVSREDGHAMQAAVPPPGTWLSSFEVTAVGTQAASVKADYEAFLSSLVDVFRYGGFHPFLLSSTGRRFDFGNWTWDYSGASYEVTVKEYRDVAFLWPGSPACSRDRNTGRAKTGVYNSITASITLCTYGVLSESDRRTGVHELFHATQFGSPAVARVSMDLLGDRRWIFEGTAVLSERSMTNTDYVIERAVRDRRPVDVPFQSSGNSTHLYEYRAQDFFAYLGDRIGADFRFVRYVFDEGPTVRDFETLLGTRYGLSWEDVYTGWVRHQIEDVPQSCSFLESTLVPNARSLSYHDGATGDSSFVVGSLDTTAAIITLENRNPTQSYEWGLAYHYQDGRSRARLYAMDSSSTTGCLTPVVLPGPHFGPTGIGVSAGPNEVRRLLLVVSHVETWDRLSSGFLRVVDRGYGSGPPVSVRVDPTSVTLPVNGTHSFTATVTGSSNTSVSWSATCGSLDGSGNTVTYTAPGTAGSCSLTAKSLADTAVSGSATISVRSAASLRPSRNSVAAGVHHTLAVLDDQSLWVWGSNYHGQLGVGLDYGLPECSYGTCSTVPIRGPDIGRVISVAAGFEHSVALVDDGTVWTWGWNAMGQLGDGSTVDRDVPIRVPGLTNVVSIGAGSYHSLAVDTHGDVWAWGENLHGGLGIDPDTGPDNCEPNICSKTPRRVAGIEHVVSVHGGDYHTIALTSDGSVWGWGFFLGRGDGTTEDRHEPVRLPYVDDVQWVDSAWYTSFAVDAQGGAWIWGESWPCLADSRVNAPTPLAGVSGVVQMTLVMMQAHCVAATGSTDVFEWGWVGSDIGRIETPRVMADLSDLGVLRTSLMHTIAVTRSGDVFAWGENYYGMLGDGTTAPRERPVQVYLPRPVWSE